MSSTVSTFFETTDTSTLPVLEFLSPVSREAIASLLSGPNQAIREKRLLEYFRSLDWLDKLEMEDITQMPYNPFAKLSDNMQRQIQCEIRQYLSHQQNEKYEQARKRADQRHERQLRFIEYFRIKVPAADKILLEALRDYELDATGRDTNWQHYFSMKSFKRVDEFLAMSPRGRQQRMDAFKHDVQTYCKNRERWGQEQSYREEWVWDAHEKSSGKNHASKPAGVSQVHWAFVVLELPPQKIETVDLNQIKKQFRQLTLQRHPDMPGGCVEKMKELLAAYEYLKKHI